MTVAFGTSTPTSITVVETSTSISPAEKACIVASFNSVVKRPCSGAILNPLSAPACNFGANSSTEAISGDCSPYRKSRSASSELPAAIRGATM